VARTTTGQAGRTRSLDAGAGRWRPIRRVGLAAFVAAATGTAPGQVIEFHADDGGEYQFVSTSSTSSTHLRFDDLLRPEFTLRDAQVIAESLGLDAGQVELVRLLIEDYGERFDAASAPLRELQPRLLPEMSMPLIGERPDAPDGAAVTVELDISGGGEMPAGGEGRNVVIMARRGDVDVDVTDGPGGGPGDGGGGEADAGGGDDGVSVSFDVTDETGASVLSEEQRRALEATIRARIAERRAAMEAARAARAAAEAAAGPMPGPEEIAAMARGLRDERIALRSRFESDVEIVLTDPQRERLPACWRRHRRVNDLPLGTIGGERLDLGRIADRMQPGATDPAGLSAARSAWAAELDETLRARRATFIQEEIDAASLFGRTDAEDERATMIDRASAARVAVRDANLRGLEAMAAFLDEQEAVRFRRIVMERAFPMIARRDRASRALEEALALDGLTDEQRTALDALAASHEQQRWAMIDAMVADRIAAEPKLAGEVFDFTRRMRSGESPAGPPPFMPLMAMGDALERRGDLSRTSLDALRSIIGEEAMAELPSARPRARSIERIVPGRTMLVRPPAGDG